MLRFPVHEGGNETPAPQVTADRQVTQAGHARAGERRIQEHVAMAAHQPSAHRGGLLVRATLVFPKVEYRALMVPEQQADVILQVFGTPRDAVGSPISRRSADDEAGLRD